MIAALAATLIGLYQPHDGDSGRLVLDDGRSVKIRLQGADAGEVKPFTRCKKHPNIWACSPIAIAYGPIATRRARELARQPVHCIPNGDVTWKRLVVRCTLADGRDLGSVLVQEGLAISERDFHDPYHSEEQEARTHQRGVWRGR